MGTQERSLTGGGWSFEPLCFALDSMRPPELKGLLMRLTGMYTWSTLGDLRFRHERDAKVVRRVWAGCLPCSLEGTGCLEDDCRAIIKD